MCPRIPVGQLPAQIEPGPRIPAAASVDTAVSPGVLTVVPTPIGNWDDITLRGLHALRTADMIAAEDPNVTGRLLNHFGIATPLCRYSGRPEQIPPLLAALAAGQMLALVCDAGTPTIADPGLGLISAALVQDYPVIALPGAIAAMTAISGSGISAQRFVFDGFPPRNRADRATFFRRFAAERRTMVLYESGPMLRATLTDLIANLEPQRQIALARDLTTPRETWWRGSLQAASSEFNRRTPRGQYILVVAGHTS